MRTNDAANGQAWKSLSAAVYRAFPTKRVAAAVALTLFAHGAIYEAAPETLAFLERTVVPATPVKIVRRENFENVPENLLPEKFRRKQQFVPVTPTAPVATPKDDSNFSAADQRAAQENPDPNSRDRTPTLDGEADGSLAVPVDAVPRELLPPELRAIAPTEAPPLSPGKSTAQENAFSENATSADAPAAPLPKSDSGTLAAGKKSDAPAARDAVPDPSPRPQIAPPAGLKMITMRSNTAVNELGSCSLDAKFSEFGDYTQRMLEAIQAEWYLTVHRTALVQPPATVVVEFTLNSRGEVYDAKIIYSDASQAAAFACLDSVSARAPFDFWRADMVAIVGGESDTVRISFHYR